MGREVIAAICAATIVAVVALCGCSGDHHRASSTAELPPSIGPVTSTAAPQAAPLPPAEALANVLYRLADPSVPGDQKLNLVQGATPDHAGALDQFSSALVNGGFAPTKFDIRNIDWSDQNPADVVADVNISSANPNGPRFSFPMEFTPYRGGWQLSARTADVLLAFGPASPPPASAPGH
jgi:hypothetical protein